jgi:hypothetical protein
MNQINDINRIKLFCDRANGIPVVAIPAVVPARAVTSKEEAPGVVNVEAVAERTRPVAAGNSVTTVVEIVVPVAARSRKEYTVTVRTSAEPLQGS